VVELNEPEPDVFHDMVSPVIVLEYPLTTAVQLMEEAVATLVGLHATMVAVAVCVTKLWTSELPDVDGVA
jgi:hypothetical protein